MFEATLRTTFKARALRVGRSPQIVSAVLALTGVEAFLRTPLARFERPNHDRDDRGSDRKKWYREFLVVGIDEEEYYTCAAASF